LLVVFPSQKRSSFIYRPQKKTLVWVCSTANQYRQKTFLCSKCWLCDSR